MLYTISVLFWAITALYRGSHAVLGPNKAAASVYACRRGMAICEAQHWNRVEWEIRAKNELGLTGHRNDRIIEGTIW